MRGFLVLVHDGLEDGGKGGDANAGGDEDSVLSSDHVTCRGTIRAINVDLKRKAF